MSHDPWRPGFSTALAAHPRDRPHTLRIRFNGSGSEYFRIWIVNLFLILVTFTLYMPWARARKLRYFYGKTWVDGDPLAFHGDPWKMFRGYALCASLLGLYFAAGPLWTKAGFVAALVLILLWPTLLNSALRFRLANTSWRGLRFRFTGSVRGAYEAATPFYVFIATFLVLASWQISNQQSSATAWLQWAMLFVLLAMLLVGPWFWWKIKKYQHDHLACAGLETRFKASRRSFFAVFSKAAGVTLAGMLLASVFLLVAMMTIVMSGDSASVELVPLKGKFWLFFALHELQGSLVVVAVYAIGAPYFKSRMQNLVWSNTSHRQVRFESDLTFRRTFRLTLKNLLLLGLTLGLYWPFAAVAMARLRLQAISVYTRVDPKTWTNRAETFVGEAAGDAAGEFTGLDLGV